MISGMDALPKGKVNLVIDFKFTGKIEKVTVELK
jgi:hypothetical protein